MNILSKLNNYLYRIKLLTLIICVKFNSVLVTYSKNSLDLFLDLFIERVYNKICRLNFFILFSIAFYINIIFKNENIFFLELYSSFLLIGTLIILIIISKN